MAERIDGRANGDLRRIEGITDFQTAPEGSVYLKWGQTHVICSAIVEERVPKHRLDSGGGWLTAEYNMLPGSGSGRINRSRSRLPGRTAEIQRLIGRSLRAVVDLDKLPPITVTVDCDVVNADGGTRCASITGAYIALVMAFERYQTTSGLKLPPIQPLSAVSVGVVDGQVITDLCYTEDSTAHVDMNVVATDCGVVEVQGTGESGPFSREQLNELIDAGIDACVRIQAFQHGLLAQWRKTHSV
ncbi:MAG: ribonuclease PH [Bradymonadia bacterium]